ncbi:hypothetical protein ACH4ZX_02710 [Streptomyces sp. NPDC020490]|uniref:hypothetical protein n=1 Tax=Streptomyces sp. NPDC020490 TaxID=3365078 RepID=UPI0037A1351D
MFALVLPAERVSPRTLLAGFAGVLGVALVVLRGDAQPDLLGVLAGAAGTASMSAGNVMTKRWGRPPGAPPALDGRAITGYLCLALVNTALAYWLWLRGIGRLPATSVSFLGC